MISSNKGLAKAIQKNEIFRNSLMQLSIGGVLDNKTQELLLSLAILLLKEYEKDNRNSTYFEFSYYIILKVSIQTNNFKPLLDLSLALGYYPISNVILNKKKSDSAFLFFIEESMIKFTNKNKFVETLQQKNITSEFLSDQSKEKSYIAPTSFGKSSLIIDIINNSKYTKSKIAIIVPTKSLLTQTYHLIKNANMDYKIIIHDEMYHGEESFIGVFTQERALRLLNKYEISYDLLIIDEAHKLLDKDDRSVLLSRLIKKNQAINTFADIIYLSPLLERTNSLRINNEQIINQHSIKFNIKEPDIFEFNQSNVEFVYNRFLDDYFELGVFDSSLHYLIAKSKTKNFIFTNRPVKIERLAKDLYNFISPKLSDEPEIIELKNILAKEVHPEYPAIKYLDAGIVYLHGKLPDLLKEYLEYKFKTIKSLKYLIANTVILEGVNLPIDNMFILNTWGLNGKDLVNLIGRVNRLDLIFNPKCPDLTKLLPTIHFVHSPDNTDSRTNMRKKIGLLKSSFFNDEIQNPILAGFDNSKVPLKEKIKIKRIQDNEDFLFTSTMSDIDKIKKYLIEEGISIFFNDINIASTKILFALNEYAEKKIVASSFLDVMELIYSIFIKDNLDNICDFEFKRLNNIVARNYYANFLKYSIKRSLQENVISEFNYFKKLAEDSEFKLYFGIQFGEVPYESSDYLYKNKNVYVQLSKKTDSELINLAVIKNKIETDFIGFKLNKCIVFIHDFGLMTTDQYNECVYGSSNEARINFTKYGLSLHLISCFLSDNQLDNIEIDKNNRLHGNQKFQKYKFDLDDYLKFEINKFIN